MPWPVSLTTMRTHPSAEVDGHVDAAVGARELHRVVQQVPENLLDAPAIGGDARQVASQAADSRTPLASAVGLQRLDRRVDGGADVERPASPAGRYPTSACSSRAGLR